MERLERDIFGVSTECYIGSFQTLWHGIWFMCDVCFKRLWREAMPEWWHGGLAASSCATLPDARSAMRCSTSRIIWVSDFNERVLLFAGNVQVLSDKIKATPKSTVLVVQDVPKTLRFETCLTFSFLNRFKTFVAHFKDLKKRFF